LGIISECGPHSQSNAQKQQTGAAAAARGEKAHVLRRLRKVAFFGCRTDDNSPFPTTIAFDTITNGYNSNLFSYFF
jgi:hypothetical protein